VTTVRVVVADDHPVFRDGLASALTDRGIEVVDTCADGAAAVRSVQAHGPDVALMDLSMPDMGGLEATRRIASEHPDTDVLVLTMSADDDSILAALRSGARGYLLKESDPDDIADAVRAVARGASVLGSRVSQRVMDMLAVAPHPGAEPPFPSLTAREREVLDLVARGYDNARVARHLGLSAKTIRNVVSIVLSKLRVATRAEAVAVARDAGLGDGP
jgi:DNA-binding NarL/FixJ family response regulator